MRKTIANIAAAFILVLFASGPVLAALRHDWRCFSELVPGVCGMAALVATESPFGWPGGKRGMKRTLLALIPSHRAYVEVFSGSAKLLFGKEPSEWEILNDANGDLINFFRVAKHRPAELAERLELDMVAAARFSELKHRTRDPQAHTDDEIERAVRFIYLTWHSYGCKGEHFASARIESVGRSKTPLRHSLATVRAVLEQTSTRLRNVLVEDRDFAECITRFDSPDTFFYCDPPYTSFQSNGRYKPLGERNTELFSLLSRIRGKFLMSFDHCAEVLRLCHQFGFRPRRVKALYTLAQRSVVTVNEVLIANYPLRRNACSAKTV